MTKVLVVDDEPQILRALRINLPVRGYEVVTASTGDGAFGRPQTASRRNHSRPRPSRHLGHRGDRRAARLADGAGDRAVCAHRLVGQSRGAGRRRRRLRHQTVRDGRVPGDGCARRPPRRRGAGDRRAVVETARSQSIWRRRGDQERHRSPSHADRVGHRGDAGPQPRQAGGREELLKEVWGPK